MRRQLAAYSPLSVAGILRAASRAAIAGSATGKELSEFLALRYGAERVVLTDRGTSALRLALRLATEGQPQRGVALPAYTCFEVATAAVGEALPIYLYDVEPRTLAPDLDSLRVALRNGARAVVVAPLFGIPVPWDELTTLASHFGAVLIEDAAQGYGATWNARPVGSLGTMSVLSFGRGKGWTGAGGGALLLRNLARANDSGPNVTRPTYSARVFAKAVAQLALGRPGLYALPASVPALGLGRTRYSEPAAPKGMSRFSAALALETRASAEAEAQVRRRTADHWRAQLAAADAIHAIVPTSGADAGYLRFPMIAEAGGRALLASKHAQRLGAAIAYPSTLAELPAVQPLLADRQERWPGAAELVRKLVTLPTHSLLSEADREAIAALLGNRSALHNEVRSSLRGAHATV